MDEGEDCGGSAYPQRERKNGGGGEDRRLPELSYGVADGGKWVFHDGLDGRRTATLPE